MFSFVADRGNAEEIGEQTSGVKLVAVQDNE
jgi:hypothetical protein